MQISLIAAMSNHRVIGKANQLPWHLSADLKRFKALTWEKPIVMGRKTYESIGKPLPHRENIILTSDRAYQAEGCQVVHSIDEILEVLNTRAVNKPSPPAPFPLMGEGRAEEVFIIGGAQLYAAFLPLAQRIYLTLVDAEVEGDAFFPVFDEQQWKVVSCEEHAADEKNEYSYKFLVLEKGGKIL